MLGDTVAMVGRCIMDTARSMISAGRPTPTDEEIQMIARSLVSCYGGRGGAIPDDRRSWARRELASTIRAELTILHGYGARCARRIPEGAGAELARLTEQVRWIWGEGSAALHGDVWGSLDVVMDLPGQDKHQAEHYGRMPNIHPFVTQERYPVLAALLSEVVTPNDGED